MFAFNMLSDEDTNIDAFSPEAEGADSELASEVTEVISATEEVSDEVAAAEEGVAISETLESLVDIGRAVAAGSAVSNVLLFSVESQVRSIPAQALGLDVLDKVEFESIATDGESAIRARLIAYTEESFVEKVKKVVAETVAYIKRIFDNIMGMLLKLFVSAAKIKKSYEELAAKLGKDGYEDSTDAKVSLSATWLNDGKKPDPAAAVAAAEKLYTGVQGVTKKLASAATAEFKKIASGEADKLDSAVQAIEKQRSQSYSGSPFVEVAGRKPVTSNGVLKFMPPKKIEQSSISALSKSALIAFVKSGGELASILEKHKESVKEIKKLRDEEVKMVEELAGKMAKGGDEDAAKASELRRKLVGMTKVSASKEIASLSTASGIAFRVAVAGLSFAKSNAAALAKKS